MPVTFNVFGQFNLVYVRYEGLALVAEGFEAFGAYMQHPDFNPAHRQLVDLSGVTEVEQDFPRLFALQAKKAAAFMRADYPTMLVYYAPTELSLGMARLIQRSWEGLDGVILRIVQDEAAVQDILGLPSLRLTDLAPRSV